MATVKKLGEALEARLKEYARNIGNGTVSIGFLSGATYPDGTSVAQVAFWNEFGTKGHASKTPGPSAEAIAAGEAREPELVGGSPPRPFFRRMVAKESPEWADHLGKALIATKGDGPKALALMGEEIKGQLMQSINELTEPPLAASTIRRKGFSKPLIDTAHMLNSVAYRVD
jgi:hypothetical protein